MKTNHSSPVTFVILFAAVVAAAVPVSSDVETPADDSDTPVAATVRDPFWPVGYRPEVPRAKVEEPVVVETVKPIEDEEWDLAKAKIPKVSGIFIGSNPVTGTKTETMLLGGKSYFAGDSLCLTNNFVVFTWKIDSISFKSTQYKLSPVSAVRVPPDGK